MNNALHEKRRLLIDLSARLGKFPPSASEIWLQMIDAICMCELNRAKAREYAEIEMVVA